jgi:hypothetical protein
VSIICPKCGKEAKSTNTKYGTRNYCCDLYSWGDYPLVSKGTHKSRIKAHESFDRLWKSGLMKRSDAYTWLAKTLDIPQSKCHIKQFNKKMCRKVIQVCRNFKQLEGYYEES